VGRGTTNQPKLEVFIGFDSEWVDASHEDYGIPPNTTNRILSWQLYLLSPPGASCSLLVEAKGGAKPSRRELRTLLGMVVRQAISEGVIPSAPDIIHLSAHFSRADLSSLRDFSQLKRRFSAVRRTYATTMKPLVLYIPTNQGRARISVRLVDTMLIAPAGASLHCSVLRWVCQRLICLPVTQRNVWMCSSAKDPRNLHATRSSTPRSRRAGPLAFFRWSGPKWVCRVSFPHLAVSASR
jgi:hypothetical protein